MIITGTMAGWKTSHFRSALGRCSTESLDMARKWLQYVREHRDEFPKYDDTWISHREDELITAFRQMAIRQALAAIANLEIARLLINNSIHTNNIAPRHGALNNDLGELKDKGVIFTSLSK